LEQHGKCLKEAIFIIELRTPSVTIAAEQVQCKKERILNERNVRITIPIIPVEMFNLILCIRGFLFKMKELKEIWILDGIFWLLYYLPCVLSILHLTIKKYYLKQAVA
jgi:hypothetical protein